MTPEFKSYFDHDADIGIEGHGDSPEAAFESAAEAMFAVMTDLSSIRPVQEIRVEFFETDLELALVVWLNRLLAAARENNLAFSRFRLRQQDGHWSGSAWGEPWQETFERGVEVKGATLTMLSVKQSNGSWRACCVVDV